MHNKLLDSSTVEHPAVNRVVVGSNPTRGANFIGAHSSAVEQSAHNRSVPGSNPGGPTILNLGALMKEVAVYHFFFFIYEQ